MYPVLYLLCISENVTTRLLTQLEYMLVTTGHHNTLESDVVRSGDISRGPGVSLADLNHLMRL